MVKLVLVREELTWELPSQALSQVSSFELELITHAFDNKCDWNPVGVLPVSPTLWTLAGMGSVQCSV